MAGERPLGTRHDVEVPLDPALVPRPEPSLGELLARITSDTTELVRAEMKLARAELRQMGATVAADATKVGIGIGLALAGALATTAFLVVAVGAAIGNYWLAALIVGVVLLGAGALLVRGAVADIRARGLVPEQTLATLREDAAWAKRELADVKQELTR